MGLNGLITLGVVGTVLVLTIFMCIANVAYSKSISEMQWLFPVITALLGAVTEKYLHSRKAKAIACDTDPVDVFLNSNKVLLLVEDSPTVITGITSNLRKYNFRGVLRFAGSCEVALKMLKEEPPYEIGGLPDIVILDMMWPAGQMQGVDLIKAIRADKDISEVEICILSAREKSEFDQSVLDTACCYVVKNKLKTLITALAECSGTSQVIATAVEKRMSMSQRLKAFKDKEDDENTSD